MTQKLHFQELISDRVWTKRDLMTFDYPFIPLLAAGSWALLTKIFALALILPLSGQTLCCLLCDPSDVAFNHCYNLQEICEK